jgi:hypothetical protein
MLVICVYALLKNKRFMKMLIKFCIKHKIKASELCKPDKI